MGYYTQLNCQVNTTQSTHRSYQSLHPPVCPYSPWTPEMQSPLSPLFIPLFYPIPPIASFIFPLPIPSQPSEFPCPLSDASYLPSEASVFHQKLSSSIRSFRPLSETSCLPSENSCLPSGAPFLPPFHFIFLSFYRKPISSVFQASVSIRQGIQH